MELEQEVGYRINGVLKEDSDKFLSKQELKNNPPVLEFFLGNGGSEECSVKFELTEDLTQDLLHDLSQLDRAYKGITTYHTYRNISFIDRLKMLPLDFTRHKIYFLFLGLILFLFLTSYFLQ